VEAYSDLVSDRDAAELEELVIAIVRRERNPEQQCTGDQG
jgi:hypothetical protein